MRRDLGIAVLMCAALVVGCGGDDERRHRARGGRRRSRSACCRSAPRRSTSPAIGLFKEEGIEIEPQLAQGGSGLVTSLVAGDSQFAFLGYVPVIVAHAKNLPIKVIANADNGAKSADKEWQIIMSARLDVRGPKISRARRSRSTP